MSWRIADDSQNERQVMTCDNSERRRGQQAAGTPPLDPVG